MNLITILDNDRIRYALAERLSVLPDRVLVVGFDTHGNAYALTNISTWQWIKVGH